MLGAERGQYSEPRHIRVGNAMTAKELARCVGAINLESL